MLCSLGKGEVPSTVQLPQQTELTKFPSPVKRRLFAELSTDFLGVKQRLKKMSSDRWISYDHYKRDLKYPGKATV